MRKPGFKHSAETKAKMRTARLGKKGTPHSEEWKIANSIRTCGHQVSAETRAKISSANSGRKLTFIHRAKLSASAKIRKSPPCSEEKKSKIKAANIENLKGQRFSELEVIEYVDSRGSAKWLCKCSCGKTTIIRAHDLKNGHTTSCGHKKTVSNSEKAFLDGLEQAWNIKIERQKEFLTERGRRYFDGFVEDGNLLIECDGSYFHSKPDKIENDLFKERVANANGYAVLHFKIDDVKAAKKLLEKA